MGDFEHRGHVRAAVPVRLVPGNGLAAMWPYHGALVVAERARQHRFGLELCP
ncbi:hypothetical protein D3C78_1302700 [compost metagenome]